MTRELRAAAVDEAGGVEAVQPEAKSSLDVSIDESFVAPTNVTVRRRLSVGSLIMGGVVLVAGASLWSMRAIDRAAASGPRASKEVEELVADVLQGKARPATIETDAKVLLQPTEEVADVRVPLKDLQKDPFLPWQPPLAGTADAPKQDVPVDTRAAMLAQWQTMVDGAAAAIRVQSTMSGTGPQGATGIANINGHMMRIGDVFGVDKSDVEFTVESIARDEVVFRAYSSTLSHERQVTVKVIHKW